VEEHSVSDTLLQFKPLDQSGRATLAVDLSTRSPHPVSPLLYSKFCEHLGCNIYRGMEAQILSNATFFQMKVKEGAFEHVARRNGWPSAAPLAEACANGGATGWLRVGPAESVALSPDAGPHGAWAQRVETPGATDDAPCGIGQWTCLPLHRTRGYEFRVVARAVGSCKAALSLMTTDEAGEPDRLVAQAALSLSDDWQTLTGRLDIPADAELDIAALYMLTVTTNGPANIVLDRVMLYPDDHIDHADPDIIRMLKSARLPLLRWPGGNFVSGYCWRDGVGPVDARPTKPNRAWANTPEPNYFGTDEFITYCRHIGCEPLICVNAGDGTADEAAAWVEYCNGDADTPMGRLRAENGHSQPYDVKYWEIGNEIFGRHQIGWTTPAGNVDRFLRFSAAMRAADPTIRILACGGLHLDVDHEWNRRLNEETGGLADLQTHHILEGGGIDDSVDPEELYHAFMGYPIRLAEVYRAVRQRMLDAGIGTPRLAITELQLFPYDERKNSQRLPLPTNSTISEALYTTMIIHECIRLGDLVEMVTHSATVNHGGGLRKVRGRVWANPIHHAHEMGVELAGGTPVGVRLACGTFATAREFGHLPVVEAGPDLDAMAVLGPDDSKLILMLVHRSSHAGPVELTIDLGGFPAAEAADVLALTGESFSDQNTSAEPERIRPQSSTCAVCAGKITLTLQPYSLVRITVGRRA
jgi:alpha-L-arabinofuranosidase